MKKSVNHTSKDNFILLLAISFIVAGFLFSQVNSFSTTGMFIKREQCKISKDPFSGVSYCRGSSTAEYCVWNSKLRSCDFVRKAGTCGKNNHNGLCPKPSDTCTKYIGSYICRKK